MVGRTNLAAPHVLAQHWWPGCGQQPEKVED
jgi:hypothetical protein